MLIYGTMNQTDLNRAWRAVNPTPGTGIVGPAVAAFSDTSAVFALFNNSPQPPGKMIVFDYLKLIVTGPPGVTPTSLQFSLSIDTAQRGVTANVGTAVANASSDSIGNAAQNQPAAGSIAFAQFGALTPTAQSTKRALVGRSTIKTQASPCLVVGDEILIISNGEEQGMGVLNGGSANRYVYPVGLVTIGPGGLFLIHHWMPGLAGVGPSYEYEAQWWELS